jgi:hypothetical protein
MVPSPRKHHHCSPNNRLSSLYLTFLNTGPSYHQTLLTTFDVQADMTCKEVIWLCSNNSEENRMCLYRYLPCYAWTMAKSIIVECHSVLSPTVVRSCVWLSVWLVWKVCWDRRTRFIRLWLLRTRHTKGIPLDKILIVKPELRESLEQIQRLS